MMEYINHITLNTGHVRKTYQNEINKEFYFMLNRLYKDMLNGEVELFDKYTIKTTATEIGTLITLYGPNMVPIITTAISNSDDGTIWEHLHTSATIPIVTDAKKMPPLPYIADRIELGSIFNMDAMKWTADFSRCMGWICLAPHKIR